ncbi:MAG: hypothetical protein ACRCZ6_09315 [Kluyvera sp.]
MTRRPDKRSAIGHSRAYSRMAAMPYPAYGPRILHAMELVVA